MLIVFSKYLVPSGFVGLTIYPFVFLKSKKLNNQKVLINHEKIHLRQQLEMAVIFFFIWYALEFLFYLITLKNKNKAYRMISFEKEAYENEANLKYLESRKWFKFLSYL